MAITIPEKFYVGLRTQPGNSLPLGFATPDTGDAAFKKRKDTVDTWTRYYNQLKPLDPTTFENVLIEGFEISKEVRRYGWNGGNVVWRLIDPRGFELEISSNNFARIVDCTTIVNGVIQGKCVWGRDGAANILLPENSEPYKAAAVHTTRRKQKVIKPADIKLGYKIILKNGNVGIYCGEFHFITQKIATEHLYGQGHSHVVSFGETIKRHVYKQLEPVQTRETYNAVVKLETVEILESQEATGSFINDVQQALKEYRLNVSTNYKDLFIMGVLDFAPTTLEFKLEDVDTHWVVTGEQSSSCYGPTTYVIHGASSLSRHPAVVRRFIPHTFNSSHFQFEISGFLHSIEPTSLVINGTHNYVIAERVTKYQTLNICVNGDYVIPISHIL